MVYFFQKENFRVTESDVCAMDKVRDTKWDNVKAVLIFLVVLGHLSDNYTANSALARALFFFVYLFHMPLFIFISGLFSKRYIKERRYEKILFFLFFYFILKFVMALQTVLLGSVPSFSLWTEGWIPWYCLAIFVFYLITIVVDQLPRWFVLPFSVLLACFVGYDSAVNAAFVQSRIIVFYPFFFLGYILSPQKVGEWLSKRWIRIFGIVVLLGVGTFLLFNVDHVYWVRGFLTGQNPFSNWSGRRGAFGGLVRLMCYGASTVMGAALIAVVPKKMGKLVSTVGRRSLEVYALHMPVYTALYHFGLQSWMNYLLPTHPNFLIFPIAVVVTLVCTWSGFEKAVSFIRERCFPERSGGGYCSARETRGRRSTFRAIGSSQVNLAFV